MAPLYNAELNLLLKKAAIILKSKEDWEVTQVFLLAYGFAWRGGEDYIPYPAKIKDNYVSTILTNEKEIAWKVYSRDGSITDKLEQYTFIKIEDLLSTY